MSWGLSGDLGVGMASDGAGAFVRGVTRNKIMSVKVFRTYIPLGYGLRKK